MATADFLFDASTFCYPESLGDLSHLVEEAPISSFILSFRLVNNKVKLDGDQLRECWLHALHQEYKRSMSNNLNMTQDQIQYIGELLSRGIKKADTFQWLSTSEWETAEYGPNQKMNYEVQRQVSKRTNFLANKLAQRKSNQNKLRTNELVQDYDPLLLLQSMPEISDLARRLYQDGIQKFMRKTKGKFDSKRVQEYKLHSVVLAYEHVKEILRISYAAEEKARAGQTAYGGKDGLKTQLTCSKWERKPQWVSVFEEIRAERERIASEIETGPLTNLSAKGVSSTIKEKKRLLRRRKAKENKQSIKVMEATGVQTRSMLNQNQTPRYNDSVMGIQNGFKNLLRGEENMLHLPDLQNKEKLQRAIVKAETHDELYGDEEDDMESEMSGRIAKLKV